MEEMTVKRVDLMGDTIMAAQDKEGTIWAGINFFCRGLGMSKRQRDFQVEKVKADKTLSKGCRLLRAGVLDIANEVYALRLDFVPIWLSKITITKKMEQETPDLADKLLQYQLKAKDILAAAFIPKQETAGDVQGQIKLLAQGATELYQRMDGLEERFQKLESDMPIFNVDAKNIQDAVRKRAIEILGGKDSNAYRDRSVRSYVFSDIQCMLRRNFGVKRYEEIKHKRVDDAIRLIHEHKPLLVIQDKVDMANAQMRMEL